MTVLIPQLLTLAAVTLVLLGIVALNVWLDL